MPVVAAAALFDAVLVILFVVIGRRNHHEGVAASGVYRTAAPFLLALVVGWIATRAWKRPTAVVTGIVVWFVIVALGLVLRRFVFHGGTAGAFVIVAALFNLATLVGWRAVYARIRRRASSGVVSPRG